MVLQGRTMLVALVMPVMLVRGFADAITMRTQQALAAGGALGYLPPEHFDQFFSAHGTIMIFLVAMPFVTGVMNFSAHIQRTRSGQQFTRAHFSEFLSRASSCSVPWPPCLI